MARRLAIDPRAGKAYQPQREPIAFLASALKLGHSVSRQSNAQRTPSKVNRELHTPVTPRGRSCHSCMSLLRIISSDDGFEAAGSQKRPAGRDPSGTYAAVNSSPRSGRSQLHRGASSGPGAEGAHLQAALRPIEVWSTA